MVLNHFLLSKDVNSDNCCSCLSAQKTFIARFWHPVCDRRALMFYLAHMMLQIGCWHNRGGQCQWTELLQLRIYNLVFSGHTCTSTHPPTTNQDSLSSLHFHSKEHPAVSKSFSLLPWRCFEH